MQVIALQLQAVDLQARNGPVSRQLQLAQLLIAKLAQLLIAIQTQVPDAHLTQLDCQR
ncbi:hypothetical protein D3C81_830260 [compost metagenome]